MSSSVEAGRSPLAVNLSGLAAIPAGDIVVPIFQDQRPLSGVAGLMDWRSCGRFSRMLLEGVFAGERGELLLTVGTQWDPARRMFLFGLGHARRFGAKTVRDLMGGLWAGLIAAGSKSVLLCVPHSRHRDGLDDLFITELPAPPDALAITVLASTEQVV